MTTRPTLTARRAGDFRATCRRRTWVPIDQILALPSAQQPKKLETRWDRKLGGEVGVLTCRLDTTDRAVYLEHLKERHGGGYRYTVPNMRARWSPPRLQVDGAPLRVSTEALERRLRDCPRCGLVAEVNHLVGDRWWDEHRRFCAGAKSDAA